MRCVLLVAALIAFFPHRLLSQDSAPQLLSRTGGKGAWSSVAELEKTAAKGDPKACADLGEMLVSGTGIAADVPRAIGLLERAARAGQASAAFRMGKLYESGEGVPKDLTRALDYFKAATAGGVAEAYYNVGAAYASARGTKRDFAEGLAWMILARQNGAPADGEEAVRKQIQRMRRPELVRRGENRAAELGRELVAKPMTTFLPAGDSAAAEGSGAVARPSFKPGDEISLPSMTPKVAPVLPKPVMDEDPGVGPPVKVVGINGQRFEWPSFEALQRAADRGRPEALFALGQLFLEGDRLPPGMAGDVDRALVHFERAADAGSVDAAFRLADLYARGRKVAMDDARAFKYMLMAARGGARTAIHNVGALYANGRGTPANQTEALAWLMVAEKYGANLGAAAKLRDYLARNAPAQIAVAEKRAAEYEREIEAARKRAAE